MRYGDRMDTEITTGELERLFDTTRKTIAELGRQGIIVPAGKRGRWRLQASVTGYIAHLRAEAAGRGGEAGQTARERLAVAQTALTEAKAKQLAGELVEVAKVETFWRSKLKAFRNRILAIPSRVRDLSARQNVTLTQELLAALTELADDKAA